MKDREWAHAVSDAAIQAHGDRHYIAIAAWIEAFCAGIDWYMRSYEGGEEEEPETEKPELGMESLQRHDRMKIEIQTLGEILETLEHAEVFTKSKQRMHPDGRALYAQTIRKVRDWQKGLQDRLGYEKGGACND